MVFMIYDTSGSPHAAREPRDWDLWLRRIHETDLIPTFQIVIQVDELRDGLLLVRTSDHRQGACSVEYLTEVWSNHPQPAKKQQHQQQQQQQQHLQEQKRNRPHHHHHHHHQQHHYHQQHHQLNHHQLRRRRSGRSSQHLSLATDSNGDQIAAKTKTHSLIEMLLCNTLKIALALTFLCLLLFFFLYVENNIFPIFYWNEIATCLPILAKIWLLFLVVCGTSPVSGEK